MSRTRSYPVANGKCHANTGTRVLDLTFRMTEFNENGVLIWLATPWRFLGLPPFDRRLA